MSSFKNMKNVIPKRKYRERSQPSWRKNKGFLEKHQDYKKRARKYNSKKEQINKLREKASLKNPDEFYHAMINSRVEDGQHVRYEKEDPNFNKDEYLKILKTQNQGLVKAERYRLMKKIEKKKDDLQQISAHLPNKQVIIADSLKEGEKLYNKEKEMLTKREADFLDIDNDYFENEDEMKQMLQQRKAEYKKLADDIQKQKTLTDYYLKMDMEKQLLVSY